MELQQVRSLVTVAEHRSFTKAAAVLHVTQSSLSHSIAKLEAEIGLRLFHRTRHGVVLTSDGETLLVPARRILQDFDLFAESVSDIQGIVLGHLRLVYSQTISVPTGDVISEFARQFPGIRMQISAPRDDADIFHLVEAGVCDIGLARIDEALPGVDTEAIATETLVLLLPQSWDSEPNRTDVPWVELSDVPLIVPPAGSASRRRLDRFSAQIGITVNAVLENENRGMSIEMVRSGVAAFLASQASEIMIPGVVQKRLVPTETSEVGIVTRPGLLTSATSAFAEVARDWGRGAFNSTRQ
ncbi:LysR family transcriptional regulator [Rhodococcus artemisiae]|uniref:LysR family transcriptional regulator n=1 Tax=Rhodococcus artemisiae TaxID=714159 RepID=A0ABU7LCG3_9NOCA|nr:LysR family transcriptional regulator [Rhodococcus artemisiae]MEE2059240.1 LysR family transcriptional regulator [Rhodococcus artemisiae]